MDLTYFQYWFLKLSPIFFSICFLPAIVFVCVWAFYDFERDSHNYYLYALFSTNDPIMQLLHFLIIIELTTYNDQEVLC